MQMLIVAIALCAGTSTDDFGVASGKIVVTDNELPSEAAGLLRLVKPAAKKTDPYRSEGENSWTVNLVAVMKREPKASVNVVFYDKDDKAALAKHEPVRAIEVHPAAHNKVVTVPSVNITADQGFVANKTYIVRVTEIEGGKEIVLAETQLTLVKAKKDAPAQNE